jgi:hypothetical protein
MKKGEFDPDELALNKKDILNFCDRVLEKWSGNPSKNANNIMAMNAVKTSVIWTDDESLKAIWNEIISWIFELLYENALAQSNSDDKSWSNTMRKIKNKK